MGNCLRNVLDRLARKQDYEKSIVILTVGLDNAGKTLILNHISGDADRNVLPTMGFRKLSLKYKCYNVQIYDLGGSTQIRSLWPKYYSDIHGLIYVVDASDVSRLSENKIVFGELMSHKHVSGKPLLLFANKQDINGAIDEIDLVESLDIEHLVNTMKCPTRVETCSCVYGNEQAKYSAAGITSGYKWLLETVHKNYNTLNSRVKESRSQENTNVLRKHSVVMDTSPKSKVHSNPFVPIKDLLKANKVEANNISQSSNGVRNGGIIKNILTSKNKTAPCPPEYAIVELQPSSMHVSPTTKNVEVQTTSQADELVLSPKKLNFNARKNLNRPYTAPSRSHNFLHTATTDNIPGQVYY